MLFRQKHIASLFFSLVTAVAILVFLGFASSKAEDLAPKSEEQQLKSPRHLALHIEKSASAQRKGNSWCTASMLIKAPPETVWRAVHDERQHDPDISYSKILEQSDNQCKLEQKFCFIPFLGTSTCVTNQVEIPNQRIDYKLLQSDHFKEMEGSWIFRPADGGRATLLELTSHLDLGLPVPKMLMDGVTTKRMEKRLSHIKRIAEKSHSALARKSAEVLN
jgi:ribosome-associated toxin RatA of RatAB toxin-antitoxin module